MQRAGCGAEKCGAQHAGGDDLVRRTAAQPMAFEAAAKSHRKPVRLIPVARAAHEYYTVYWQTA